MKVKDMVIWLKLTVEVELVYLHMYTENCDS